MNAPDAEQLQEKSRTRRKGEMLALQAIGERLVGLPPGQLARIPLPAELKEAVLLAKRISRRGGLRRQRQYIGALMRRIDPQPIRAALEELERGEKGAAQDFARIEKWRDDLVAGDEGRIREIEERFPQADHRRLQRYTEQARKEREENRPPKSSRALFRYLRELAENPAVEPQE